MNSGIYRIQNVITGRFYIGSSCVLKRRIGAHLAKLIRNKHHSIRLQQSFNKHGQGAFVFGIVEYCNKSNLLEREQFYMDAWQPYKRNIGYNMTNVAGNVGVGLGNPRSDQENYKWVHKEHGEFNCTRTEMKERFGLDRTQCMMLIKGLSISANGWCVDFLKKADRRLRKDIDPAVIIKEYREGSTMAQLQKKHKCASRTVFKILSDAGATRSRSDAHAKKALAAKKLDIGYILKEYKSGTSICKIRYFFRAGYNTIKDVLIKNGIEVRGRLASQNLRRKKQEYDRLIKTVH